MSSDRAADTGRSESTRVRSRSTLTVGLLASFILMIIYGFLAGNVFDTYENGSNL